MTIDERIDKLTSSLHITVEAIGRLERATFENSTSIAKTEVLMVKALDSIMRLERIAVSHEMRLQDVEAALDRIEGSERKPQ
jgi:hypothetical protein